MHYHMIKTNIKTLKITQSRTNMFKILVLVNLYYKINFKNYCMCYKKKLNN